MNQETEHESENELDTPLEMGVDKNTDCLLVDIEMRKVAEVPVHNDVPDGVQHNQRRSHREEDEEGMEDDDSEALQLVLHLDLSFHHVRT